MSATENLETCPVCKEGSDGLFIPIPQICGSCGYSRERGAKLDSVARRLGFQDKDPAALEAKVRALVEVAAAILDDADATVPFERQGPLVQRLRAALAHFKEAPDADG
jgi:hypothetical protein